MKIGVLELVALPARSSAESVGRVILTKQFAAIMPQAVTVWCRQLGHRTHYASYYGMGDPFALLPSDLDIVFISCVTHASGLAYALAKLFRRNGALAVIGGPHAKSFPTDCLRFFDLVVRECDKELIRDIVTGNYERGSVLTTSHKPEIPLVEERAAEIEKASLIRGHQYFMTTVPILTSLGCPYDCNFCIDWNNPYKMLPVDRIKADVAYTAKRFPGAVIAFQDANFGVRFDEVLGAIASLPPASRPRYIADSSLSVIREDRIDMLRETNCVAVIAGVESWTEYTNKTGMGKPLGAAKVASVAARFTAINRHVPYLQAGLIFGLDSDAGDEPVDLTCEFMDRTPFVWPSMSTPMPLAGTPLYDQYAAEGRLLPGLPFPFYFTVYLTARLKHYHPVAYFEGLIRLASHASSRRMLARRLAATSSWSVRAIHWARTASARDDVRSYRRMRDLLETDRGFLRYNLGETTELPELYHREYDALLGRYAPLIARHERAPILEPVTGIHALGKAARRRSAVDSSRKSGDPG